MLQRHANLLSGLIVVWDLLCLQLAWTVARASGLFAGPGDTTLFEAWSLVPVALLWPFSAWLFHFHDSRTWRRRRDHVRNLIAAVSFFVGATVGLFSLSSNPPPLASFPILWAFSFVAVAAARTTGLAVLRLATACGINGRNLLIAGTGKLARDVVRRLHAVPEYGCVAKGYLSDSPGEVGKSYERVPVIGTLYDLARLVQSNVDLVLLCLPSHLESHVDKLLHELRNSTVDVKLIPSIAELDTLGLEAYMFEGLPMITLQGARVHGWDRALKRGLDILGSAAALVLTAPLCFVIALAIKLSSPGPVLYRQVRMSLAGQPFVMLKFRTMHELAERDSGPVWASPPGDPRVTTVGRLLRHTSLDELPQFWNVLKGDMSLVGPRPERPTFIETFRQAYPAYMLRLKVKAGMTGWAQINGWRGDTCLQTRIAHDLYYIEHWSLWFDLKILCQTLWKGLLHEHPC